MSEGEKEKSCGFFKSNVIKKSSENSKMLVGFSFPVLEKLFMYLYSDVKVSGTRLTRATTMED